MPHILNYRFSLNSLQTLHFRLRFILHEHFHRDSTWHVADSHERLLNCATVYLLVKTVRSTLHIHIHVIAYVYYTYIYILRIHITANILKLSTT